MATTSIWRVKGWLRALYFYYLYQMGVLPKRKEPNPKQVYFLFREDIRHMQNISRETRLLVKHGIDTAEQLAAYKESANTRMLAHDLRYINPNQYGVICKKITEIGALLGGLIKFVQALPDIISKEQLRIACHISKRTALYLLQSRLIPNETTGKKTRCYSIKKKDVITYLKDKENDPNKYQPPENWYSWRETSHKPYIIRHLPSETATKQQLEEHYIQELSNYSDVVDVDTITVFTGYNRRAVGQWCRKGRLKFIMSTPKYMIPKCFLIEYLCSDQYNRIIRKSKNHLNAIWEVHNNSHNRIPVADKLK